MGSIRKCSSLNDHNVWCFLLTITICCYGVLDLIKYDLACCMIRLHWILGVICLFADRALLREIIRSIYEGAIAGGVPIENTDRPFIACLLNLPHLIITCRLMHLFESVTRVLDIALIWTLQHTSIVSAGTEVSLCSCWEESHQSKYLILWALFDWKTGFVLINFEFFLREWLKSTTNFTIAHGYYQKHVNQKIY